jgi:transcriptional regulator with XRE-family HTH domain
MAAQIDRIKTLLGQGLSNEVVASAVGCTPSYISQLLSDEAFMEEVSIARTVSLSARTERDNTIDSIEDSLLTRLKDSIEQNMIYKPGDLLKAFQVLNAAKRRGAQAVGHASTAGNTVVNIQLPTQVLQKFVLSETKEVVEIDGQTLVSMNAGNLLNHLKETSGDAAKYEKLENHLPAVGALGVKHDRGKQYVRPNMEGEFGGRKADYKDSSGYVFDMEKEVG